MLFRSKDVDEREHQHRAQHDRQVAQPYGRDEEPTDPGPREYRFGERRANQQIREASATRDAVAAERAVWERRVSLLRPTSVDPDLLEERARTVLNLGQPDELVILLNQPKAAKPN